MLPSRKHKKIGLGQEIRGNTPGNILARLYRKILHNLGVSPERYNALFDRYVQRASLDPRKKTEIRAGLNEALLAEEMTFKTFVKGMDFLAIPSYDITITLHHANGKKTTHSITIIQEDDEEMLGEETDDSKD